jgi:hypothetical protein
LFISILSEYYNLDRTFLYYTTNALLTIDDGMPNKQTTTTSSKNNKQIRRSYTPASMLLVKIMAIILIAFLFDRLAVMGLYWFLGGLALLAVFGIIWRKGLRGHYMIVKITT